MDFTLKKPKMNKMIEAEELDEFAERTERNCAHRHGKSKADIIYKKMMDGKVKEL